MANKNEMSKKFERRVNPVDIYNIQQPEAPAPAKQVPEPKRKPKTEKSGTLQYGTYITKEQRKLIKLHALEDDITDSEIVQRALDEYFERHAL